jgi:hypothetical protein
MTPPAITNAGRGGTRRAAPPRQSAASARKSAAPTRQSPPTARQSAATAGHRRTVSRRSSPSAPRRISGPLATAGATAGALLGSAVRIPRPAPPRRRPGRAPVTRRAPSGPLTARVLAHVRALPDHSLLDRIVRGRTWIALLGLMLVGIVAMQVEVLKLGASEGRSLQQSAALQSRNELLRASVASLSDDGRIERLAGALGMVMPAPTDVVFLSPNATANANRAAGNIQAPNASSFLASLPSTSSADGASGDATGTGDVTGTPATGLETSTTSVDAGTTTPATGAGTPTGATAALGADGADTGGTAGTPTDTVAPAGTPVTGSPTTPPTAGATTTPATGTSPTVSSVSAAGGAAIAAGTPAG